MQKFRTYYGIAQNRTTMFTVSPKLSVTSPYVRQYEPTIRGCYTGSERHLKFFKQYTQRNCEMECLTNFTLAQCGCVKFSMPSKKLVCSNRIYHSLTVSNMCYLLGSTGTKVCGSAKINCCVRANSFIYRTSHPKVCDCLPLCASLYYRPSASQSEFDYESYSISPLDFEK